MLGDPGELPLRGVGPSTNGSAGVSALVQNTLDAAVLQVVGLVESSRHAGMVRLVSSRARPVATEGAAEFVGAGGAGKLAHGGDDQGTDARNGRSDDNDRVFDVAPAD